MTTIVSNLINELKTIGYDLYLDGDNLKYEYHNKIEPPKEKVILLLQELKNHKHEVIRELKKQGKYCTWLNKDVPSCECFDWCYKADRTPSTCEYFKAWWRIKEKQLIPWGFQK